MATLGIIGLGLIGEALARRFSRSGDTPVVYDLKPEAVRKAVGEGAIAANSCRDLAGHCDIVLLCVQTDAQCVAAVSGDGGLLEGARPGTCIAILSTVLPATITSLANLALARQVHLVDTPIAGRGMFSVEDGSMSVLVGDEGELVERLRPTLLLFASKIIPAGRLGSAAALKLAHNIVVYAGFAATIEAIELARAAGVRDGLVEQVTHASGALSELSEFHISHYKHFRDDPHPASDDEKLRVAAALLEKDLTDAVSLAQELGVELPMAQLLSHAGTRVFPAKP